MSTFNELGERGLNAVIQARANMVGAAPSPSMMPEIGPTLVLEADRPEWGYWKNEFDFGADILQGAVIGERGIIWVPPVENQIVVINEIQLRGTGASSVEIGWRTGLPLVAWTEQRFVTMDNRAPAVIGRYYFGSNVALGSAFDSTPGAPATPNIFYRLLSNAAGQITMPHPMVLRFREGAPLRGLMLRTSADNQGISCVMQGYSRPENPNERLG